MPNKSRPAIEVFARYVPTTIKDLEKKIDYISKHPGAFYYSNDGKAIFSSCPCGCKKLFALELKSAETPDGWENTGQFDIPSLDKVVNIHTYRDEPENSFGFHWSGTLRFGVWQEKRE